MNRMPVEREVTAGREPARHRRRAAGLAAVGSAVALVVSATTSGAWADAGGAQPGTSADSIVGEYTGVAAVSTSDVWAVGYTSATPETTLAEHWDGTKWSQVAIPDSKGSQGDQLNATAAVASDDVWAVGNTAGDWGLYGLVEHWNGKKWQIVKSVNTAGTGLNLLGVTAVSADDVWAMGFTNVDDTFASFFEHWNGKKWSHVVSPNPKGAGEINLEAISADSATDVWASGFFTTASGYSTLIEHWNGKKWTITPSPNPAGATLSWLPSVTSISASDVWAVGATSPGSTATTLTEHWNGKKWKIVKSPNPQGGQLDVLLGSTHVSDDDVWAVGTSESGSAASSLTEHWNGKKWSIVASPNLDGTGYLSGAAAIASDDVWAVGIGGDESAPNPLAEHWDGSSWSIP